MDMDVIIDANGIYARAYYALNRDTFKAYGGIGHGMAVADLGDTREAGDDAVYRVVHAGILDLIMGGHHQCPLPVPSRLAVVWDGANRRDKGRNKPESYRTCLSQVRTRLKSDLVGAHVIAISEADDTIASMAVACARAGNEVMIVTSDKDLCQVASPGIKIYSPHLKRVLDEASICARFGLHQASHVALYLAACGDSVDKIKGVSGIGPVTFAKLYSSVDKKATVAEAFATISSRLSDTKADELMLGLELTLLNYGLEVPSPLPCRQHG